MPKRNAASLPEPRFKKPWQQNGNTKSGFWYFWDGRRKVRLGVNEMKATTKGRDKARLAVAQLFTSEGQAKAETEDPLVAELIGEYLAELDRRSQIGAINRDCHEQAKRYSYDFLTGRLPSLKGGLIKPGRRVHDGFGELRISELKKFHLKDWFKFHGGKGSKKRYMVVNAALNFAVEMGRIPMNPVAGLKLDACQPRTLTWTEEELALVRVHSPPAFWQFCEALASTGARPGELAAVKPSDLVRSEVGCFWALQPDQWKNGRKTGKERFIPLPDWLIDLTEKTKEGQFILRTAEGLQWNGENWKSCVARFRATLKKKKVAFRPELRLYDLRGTFVSRAMDNGASAADVALACGTSEQMINRVYRRKTQQTVANLVNVAKLANRPRIRVADAR